MRRSAFPLVASLLLSSGLACNAASPGQSGAAEPDTSGVMQTYRERLAGIEGDDIDRWLNAHAPNVRFIDPDRPDIVGKDSLRAWGQPFFEAFTMREGNETVEELRVAGDLAFIRYQFDGQYTPKGEGEPIDVRGKGILVLQLGDDGAWKITHNIWNTPAPAPSNN